MTVPDPGLKALLAQYRSRYKGEDIIMLSFCDGVASARLALQLLVGTPRMSVAWETDPECMKVAATRYPDIIHRGNFLTDNYQQLASEIAAIDPGQQCTVVITAGTPCPDRQDGGHVPP